MCLHSSQCVLLQLLWISEFSLQRCRYHSRSLLLFNSVWVCVSCITLWPSVTRRNTSNVPFSIFFNFQFHFLLCPSFSFPPLFLNNPFHQCLSVSLPCIIKFIPPFFLLHLFPSLLQFFLVSLPPSHHPVSSTLSSSVSIFIHASPSIHLHRSLHLSLHHTFSFLSLLICHFLYPT